MDLRAKPREEKTVGGNASEEEGGEEVVTFLSQPLYDWNVFNPVLSCSYFCCTTAQKSPLPPRYSLDITSFKI